MEKRCCFIGHRNIDSDINIRERLQKEVGIQIKNGFDTFIMGAHGEFDRQALSVCKEFEKKYRINIEIVLTSFGELNKKKDDCKNTVFFDVEEIHYKRRIIECNKKMIDLSDAIVCYVDEKETRSGAKMAVRYAMKAGKPITNLYRLEDNPVYGMTAKEKHEYYRNVRTELHKNTVCAKNLIEKSDFDY